MGYEESKKCIREEDGKGFSSRIFFMFYFGNRLLRGSEANGSSFAPYSWTLFHRVGVQPNADMYRPPRFVINLKPLIADAPGSGK